MSNNAPDFSATFDAVDNQLANAEQRLKEKRKVVAKKAESLQPAKTKKVPLKTDDSDLQKVKASVDPLEKRAKPTKASSKIQIATRVSRCNLTLKVLSENEQKFNRLFLKLQLAGDARKKQDLADEALQLLFDKYKPHL